MLQVLHYISWFSESADSVQESSEQEGTADTNRDKSCAQAPPEPHTSDTIPSDQNPLQSSEDIDLPGIYFLSMLNIHNTSVMHCS